MINVTTPEDDAFARAMSTVFDAVPGVSIEPEPIAIAKFKTSCDDVLNGVNEGRIQILLEGNRRYVFLSEDQVIALAQTRERSPSLGDVVRGVVPPHRPMDLSRVHLGRRSSADPFSLPESRTGPDLSLVGRRDSSRQRSPANERCFLRVCLKLQTDGGRQCRREADDLHLDSPERKFKAASPASKRATTNSEVLPVTRNAAAFVALPASSPQAIRILSRRVAASLSLSWSRGASGQGDSECRPAAGVVVGADGSAMSVDDSLCDRKAHPEAMRLGCHEWSEQRGDDFRTQARSSVADRDFHARGRGGASYRDVPPLGGHRRQCVDGVPQ